MAEKWRLLVVDDDPLIIDSIRLILPENWTMTGAHSLSEVPKVDFHAAFVDQHLDGEQGLDVIKFISKQDQKLEIVAISGDQSRNLMDDALKAGATRFLAKPLMTEELLLVLDKIEALQILNQNNLTDNGLFIGSGESSQKLKKQISLLKGEPGPILIEGESGTGKEVTVYWIHQQKQEKPLVVVNVASISEELFESELFGHAKGSFTGAHQTKMGLVEAAEDGDLFLDEIEALSLNNQVKLLRFLESLEYRRVGEKQNRKANVRVLVATNKNLNELVEKGIFREDLMWRLNGKTIKLEPLRNRKDELSELIDFFFNQKLSRYNKKLSEKTKEIMLRYDWPGNVRELKRVCEQLCLIAPLPIIREEDIMQLIRPAKSLSNNKDMDYTRGLKQLLDDYETEIIKNCLVAEKDMDKASQILGISRSNLYKKVRENQIEF